ncbi:DUF2768 domain-containing protein [Bacillus sp. 03113]|uniref:DUF2768 domain-containing protein n=1 Tax=Bacillus sp. 03113 TaxID=2578211 RepID=UPI00114429B5|nr:DUF2768 domain-containing protein [Bacillus sp. 03113]
MSEGLMKMWISFIAMGFMLLSILFIYLSRYKLSNRLLKFSLALFAYLLMVLSGIIILLIVFSGPVN